MQENWPRSERAHWRNELLEWSHYTRIFLVLQTMINVPMYFKNSHGLDRPHPGNRHVYVHLVNLGISLV